MIVLDVNLLIYAVNEDALLHARAKPWLEKALSGPETVGFSWNVLIAFLRLTTRPSVFRNPLRIEAAFDLVSAWLDQSAATIVHAGPRHLQIMRELLLPIGSGGNLTSDAHLASLAIEHGAVLCSSDADFARFPGLKWKNPLTG
jgi:toxin-antitoxin system PIN domain toxin